jgi:hypothetical protein
MGNSPEDLSGFPGPVPRDPAPRRCKLSVFPLSHFGSAIDEDVFLTRDDFPSLTVGDVVEIYSPDPGNSSIHRY